MGIPGPRLQGKTAVVTAAAQGIGRAIALRFAAEGAAVVATDINAEKLGQLASAEISVRPLDATDPRQLEELLGAMAQIDILVNSVGWVHSGTILDCSPEEWRRSFDLNVDTIYQAMRLALPRMIAGRRGSIINIASLAGLKSAPNRAAYSASKAAVIGLTRSVSADFAGLGIRCNAICPAMIASPSLEERIQAMPDPAAARRSFIMRHPVGRLGTPEEVAGLAAYLASDESAFMTGSAVIFDGGAA